MVRGRSFVALLVGLTLGFPFAATGQQPAAPQPPTSPQEKKALTNADVVSMVKARLAESTVVLAVEKGSTNFDTSPSALIELKNQGVTTAVIEAMLRSSNQPALNPSQAKNGKVQSASSAVTASGWTVTTSISPADGVKTLILQRPAAPDSPPLAIGELPYLELSCNDSPDIDKNPIHLALVTYSAAQPASVPIGVKLDDEQGLEWNWRKTTQRESIVSTLTVAFVRRLAHSKTLLLVLTNPEKRNETIKFDITGLADYVDSMAQTCRWSERETRDAKLREASQRIATLHDQWRACMKEKRDCHEIRQELDQALSDQEKLVRQ